jgi:histidine triad (HIT) family protein
MEECIFCKIVRADIPSYKVYEDDYTLAFLDIAPVSKGHTLVIPKKHYVNFEDIPEEELSAVIKTVKRVGRMLKENFGVVGYNTQVNNDSIAGQIIPHIHFHLIPREEGDGLELWPQGGYDPGEAGEIAKKIRKD